MLGELPSFLGSLSGSGEVAIAHLNTLDLKHDQVLPCSLTAVGFEELHPPARVDRLEPDLCREKGFEFFRAYPWAQFDLVQCENLCHTDLLTLNQPKILSSVCRKMQQVFGTYQSPIVRQRRPRSAGVDDPESRRVELRYGGAADCGCWRRSGT